MELGLIINRVMPEEKLIITAAESLGVKIIQYNNQRMQMSLAAQKDIEPSVEVFLQRSLSLSRAIYTTAILESKGYTLVNNYQCLSITGDKLLTSLALGKAGIPTPKTMVAFTPETAIEAIEKNFSYPIITKPIIGSWGRMVSKLNDYEAAQAMFEAKDVMGDIFQKIHYVQEYVDSTAYNPKAPTDIRVIYIGGECVAAMGRYRQEKDFRSNITIGGSAQPYPITEELQKLCKKIAETFGGDILGIDLMETEEGFTCIEVNGTPGFSGITKATGVPIGEHIISYLKEKYA